MFNKFIYLIEFYNWDVYHIIIYQRITDPKVFNLCTLYIK